MIRNWSVYFVLALFLVGLGGCMPGPSKPLPGFMIGPPSLSPDGRLIAFTYGKTVGDNHLLLYDIESEQLRLIDKPKHIFVRGPSFSPDGQRLAVATYCNEHCAPEEQNFQIATIDLTGGVLTFLTSGRDFFRIGPIFSADGGEIFFTAYDLDWRDEWIALGRRWPSDWGNSNRSPFGGVSKISLETHEELRLFPSSENPVEFFKCTVNSATEQGDIYISALNPMKGQIESAVAEMGRKTDTLGYVLGPTGTLDVLAQNVSWPMSGISSSSDGRIQVFTSSPADKKYSYDLFQLIDGEVSQMSYLETHMTGSKVSANGQMVVFLADAKRQRNWSIWTHDVATGQTQLTLRHETIVKFLGVSENVN